MKSYQLVATLGLGLTACSKAEEENDVTPAAIIAAFDQDFTLNYRQQAILSSAISQPELTIVVADLYYSLCPKTANCVLPDSVWPTLSVTDAQGQTQQVKMPANQTGLFNLNWIDTTSVQANG